MSREKMETLIEKWKSRARRLRLEGREHKSPLVMLDKYHQAQAIEQCAMEYTVFGRVETEAELVARIKEMWVTGEIKRGIASFTAEADYWEGWMDACKHIEKFIEAGCPDQKDK